MSEDPVIVAGAGPTGMVTALGLQARGIPVELYEADPEDRDRPGSRAIFVHGATLRTLDTLYPGLGSDLAERGIIWPTRRTLFRGEEVFSRTYDDPLDAGEGLPPFTSLPQVWTEEILLDTLEEVGIDIHWNTPVETVESRPDGVTVGTGDGETHEASYVVGADGAGSTVRKEIGADFAGDQSENYFIIADIEEVPDDPRPSERVFHYDTPELGGRNLLIVPFQGGWRVDIQCKPDDDPDQLTSDAVISEYTARALGERYRDRVEWVSAYQFKQVNADTYTDEHDRVLLAGEAAHLFAPFGARGMNSGIADADAVASAIAGALTADVDAVARAEIEKCAERRQRAGEWNKDAAAQALEYLQGERAVTKAKKRLAAAVADYYEPAGEWLDDAPYGPHGSPPTSIGQY